MLFENVKLFIKEKLDKNNTSKIDSSLMIHLNKKSFIFQLKVLAKKKINFFFTDPFI